MKNYEIIKSLKEDCYKGMHILQVLEDLHNKEYENLKFDYNANTCIYLEDYDDEGYDYTHYIEFENFICKYNVER